jgi:hypothetical protein
MPGFPIVALSTLTEEDVLYFIIFVLSYISYIYLYVYLHIHIFMVVNIFRRNSTPRM